MRFPWRKRMTVRYIGGPFNGLSERVQRDMEAVLLNPPVGYYVFHAEGLNRKRDVVPAVFVEDKDY